MVTPARLCLICKGSRLLCGLKHCPLLARLSLVPKISKKVGKEFFGPSTSIFIGHFGYPDVFAGPLGALTTKNLDAMDNPASWLGKEYSEIVKLRSLLLRSKGRQNIFSKSKFVEDMQELALASKPTDIEMLFKKKPAYKVSFSDVVQPMGPTATLKKLSIAENPTIPRKVDKIASDEIKAEEAGFLLYKQGQSIYKLATILSSGILGLSENKRLVPTRWSITAVDDIIARQLIDKIKQYPSVNEYRVYSNEYLDNHFEILLIPGNWEYENFEAWAPGTLWTASLKKSQILEEYEGYNGRTSYALEEGGGYYAARLGTVEGLYKLKRQARVVVFREVYEGYMVPLGVWLVRETARNAFRNKPVNFNSLKGALNYINSKLRLPIDEYIKRSKILPQKRLEDFVFKTVP